MPVVFVVARDWTLRMGVRAELRELGIEALGMESAEDAGRALLFRHYACRDRTRGSCRNFAESDAMQHALATRSVSSRSLAH